ncbi:SLC13 family permease [Oryzicola mucosus]|uniref:SLC13 family permease n=1 Tax=Oryzicola mucosus TaxID=2767425 RepID=A0A8J6U1I2_9HYPH|nr:SLC13 family permease [Oryzicola mucosus]MBD0414493.1 SLC13 family permease [Oryzicola mucosus]
MTAQQIVAVAIIVAMMIAFLWGRLRYDLVAALALLAAIGLGAVPFDQAFSGFSDDIVIIVGSALLVSAAVARSGIMEVLIQRYVPPLKSIRMKLMLLVLIVTLLSAVVKNIGALAIMIPIAFQFAKRSNVSPSLFLMPMAFGSLLGGLMTQIGTSPNVIVSRVREEITGQSFTMFDFTPVGASLAVVGVIFLVFFYWLVPIRQRESGSLHDALELSDYVAEAEVTKSSAVLGKPVSDLLKMAEGAARISSILRQGGVRITPLPDSALKEGDVLLLQGDAEAIDRLASQAKLSLTGGRDLGVKASDAEAIEVVIGENSSLIGLSAKQLSLFDRHDVNLLAVSRKGARIEQRLGNVMLRMGDVLVLQASRARIPEMLRDFGCLPLAERPILMGSVRKGIVPLGILLAAMAVTAVGLLPVPVAFFAAAVLVVAFKAIPLREVYDALDGPILVMLAALIPVSGSLRTSGATELMGAGLSQIAMSLPAWGALALILVAAMAVTPFLNNAATVLVMAPIAATFAGQLGYRPEAFLMAVAIGAGCDFLTPIGHQCNTLVMGPGGYRFGDYSRLGLPLSILVILVAVPMLMIVWPVG